MTRQFLIAVATAGSAALLLGALGFQYIGGLAPCHLCILQRWPHLAAIIIGLVTLLLRDRILPWLGAAAALTTAGIGFYHTGVERHWFTGPTSCTSGGDIGSMTPDQLLAQINGAALVQCDQVAWQMWGLSMASWNMLASLALAAIWIVAALRSARPQAALRNA